VTAGLASMAGVIPRPSLPVGPVIVVGLARSGVAAALALREHGLAVTGCDAGPVADDARDRLAAAGVPVHERTDGLELLADAATVVKSPGVPQEAPVIVTARRTGRPVMGELEIGWRLVPNEFLAVTGSNGKTTTAELLGHIHRAAGAAVVVAGNVGTAVTSLDGQVAPDAVIVCEASSFQLEDTAAFAPDAALLLNVVEDHLDRHGTLAAYRAAKLQAFARQPRGTIAVLPAGMAGDPDIGGEATRVTFGPGGDLTAEGGDLRWRGEPLMPAGDVRLRGAHNLENAMAAAALALARGLPRAAVREALATFAGVEHRLEEVGTFDGVLYVNDSKATNVASAVVGVESFAGRVHVILGGRGKGADYGPLAAPVAGRAAGVYLIGETAAELHDALIGTGVPLHDCGDLEDAVAAARRSARPGDVILLSPACASYDQYRSFEERGRHFRALAAGG
jgi:UDP-N-acetylmuramoylalanine--D-glutamate ligase